MVNYVGHFNEVNDGKLQCFVFLVFQVLRVANEPCQALAKNGTCYTSEECRAKGGFAEGDCAEGLGVCCIFSLGCGSSTSENGTYFETPETLTTDTCRLKICKQNSNICQIRLDFQTFVISGPSTDTVSTRGKRVNGTPSASSGVAFADASKCLTDIFTISNQRTVPELCGTNTGYHGKSKKSI